MTGRQPVARSSADALDALKTASNLVGAEVSQGQNMAVDNLLEKAGRALDRGDVEQARRYVRRAKDLGHDEHEDVDACSLGAHMLLFTLVSDVVEECAAPVWLEAAEAVLPSLSAWARAELLGVLLVMAAESAPDPTERRLLRRLTAGATAPPSVWDGASYDVEQVLELLAATAAYDASVEEIERARG